MQAACPQFDSAELYDLEVPSTSTIVSTNEALVQNVQNFGIDHRYVVNKASGSNNLRVRIKCYKGGRYTNRSSRPLEGGLRSNTSTRLSHCQFLLTGAFHLVVLGPRNHI